MSTHPWRLRPRDANGKPLPGTTRAGTILHLMQRLRQRLATALAKWLPLRRPVSSRQAGDMPPGAPAPTAALFSIPRRAATATTAAAVAAAAPARTMPRPALRYLGDNRQVALREFDFGADADSVAAFQQETYSLNFPNFKYGSGFASAFRHDLRRAALDPHHGLFVLDADCIVGFLWVVTCQNSWTNERYGYINNIFIEHSQRGTGLARELLSSGEEWFKKRGIARVRLTVTAANLQACRLYQGSGYCTTRLEMEKEI